MNFRPQTPRDDDSRLSRFLALVLRHKAYRFDLRLDDRGFANLEELLEVIHEQESLEDITEEDIRQVSEGHVRTRFEIVDGNIRATYGHSLRKPVLYDRVDPPEFLYIAMASNQMEFARANGLKPTDRQYVHLSQEKEEAEEVGKRGRDPFKIVTVRSKDASENGISFHNPTNGLFLSLSVPAEYLDLAVNYGRSSRRVKRGGR